jgi:hypothetical protein
MRETSRPRSRSRPRLSGMVATAAPHGTASNWRIYAEEPRGAEVCVVVGPGQRAGHRLHGPGSRARDDRVGHWPANRPAGFGTVAQEPPGVDQWHR